MYRATPSVIHNIIVCVCILPSIGIHFPSLMYTSYFTPFIFTPTSYMIPVMACSLDTIFKEPTPIQSLDALTVADILDWVSPKFHRLGLAYECLGGGRIDHDTHKKIKILYGYSVVSLAHLHNATSKNYV